ncbi:MAG: hypothetical protein JWP09_465 [Candidatus Taylorbacteria bacterium]|nr:hypothetical protein [Candidatus Taylorbacteria bacterium]
MGSKTWKTIGIIFVVYVIIWLWPVVFHRPFFNSDNQVIPVDISPRPPMTGSGDADFKAYSLPEGADTVPPPLSVPAPTPYNPSSPDPVAPPHSADEPGNQMVVCTMEAKQCPDGSYVGRQGPKCEFAPCPGN